MKETYKITNVPPPIDEKDVVNKEYCDNNLLFSSNKIDILSKNLTELRKGDFDNVTTGQLKATIIICHHLQLMEVLFGLMIRHLN